jgi:hypothetical protein
MFGFMPLLIALNFDEVDRLYSLPFMVGLTLAMIGTAVLYLRSTHQSHRALILLTSISLITTIAIAGTTLYWLENGWVDILVSVVLGIVVVAIMFSPALLGVARRYSSSPRAL